jgi:uncharacterized iron-regulated membrane protein
MSRAGYERITRLAHRWLAVGAGGFFFLSLVTGLLWADARFLYWDDHYKEKVVTVAAPSVDAARLSFPQALEAARTGLPGRMAAEQVLLRSDFGRLLYEIKLRGEGAAVTVLLDAVTGERLSPISTELAPVIAAQYVRPPAAPNGVEIERYQPRKKKRSYDAVRVHFEDANNTEIILDRQTGEILEDEGRWRKLHFVVMQLHQLNFFGFDKTLLNVPGLPLLLMGLSGVSLWALHRRRVKRARTAEEPSEATPRPRIPSTSQAN